MKWLENALWISALCVMAASLLVILTLNLPAVRAPIVKFYIFDILEKRGYEVVWGERDLDNPIAADESTRPVVQIVDESLYLQKRAFGGLSQFRAVHLIQLKGGKRVYLLLEQPIYPLQRDGTVASGYPFAKISSVERNISKIQNAVRFYGWRVGVGFAVLGVGVSIFSWSRSRKTGKRTASRNRRKRAQQARPTLPFDTLPSLQAKVTVAISSKEQRGGHEVKDWPTLVAQIKRELSQLPSGRQKDALEQKLTGLLNSGRQRTNVAAHLMARIRDQQNGGQGTAAISDSKKQRDASRGNGALSPVTPPTFNQLLAIDQYLPPELDPEVVKAVLSRFMPPGRNMFHFNERYLPAERVRHTLGGQFPPDQVNASLEWLMKVGVVIQPKLHKGKILCSVNTHSGSVGYPGDKIISIIMKTAYELSEKRR